MQLSAITVLEGFLRAAALHSIYARDRMSARQRKRIIAMWTPSRNSWIVRLTLLTCVAFAVGYAGRPELAGAVGIPGPAGVSLAEQDNKKTINQPIAPGAKAVSDDYIIGPSDVLAINVWKDPELTRTVTVRPDGKISFPLIGELEVSGLTAVKVQHLIAQRLNEYISKPEVAVIVQEVKSQAYVVVGKIAHPGSYVLDKPTTILEAIAIAGGFLDFAKANKVYVIRRAGHGSSETLHFDYKKVIKGQNLEQNVELKGGDTIVVP